MQKQPRSLVDLSLCGITDIDQLKQLTRFEAIRSRMSHVLDCQTQILVLGETRTWHDNGQLRELVQYRDDVRQGENYTWFNTGVLKSIYRYENGRLEGEQNVWYPDGSPCFKYYYVNGAHHGEYREWSSSGRVYSKFYDHGMIVGRSGW
jgi:hypothetical protein